MSLQMPSNGKKVEIGLRPLEEKDMPVLLAWRNDRRLRRFFREWRDLTIVDQARWFESLAGDGTRAMAGIVETVTDSDGGAAQAVRLIGCCGLTGIDWFNREAEISLYVAENYVDWRAERALALLIERAWSDLGLHRLWAEVWAFDDLKADALRRAGFRHEGTKVKAHWYNDSWHDVLVFGLVGKP